jgi:hypothetical protein
VAGVVALMLEVNPELTYRDVQHLLIQSARQTDPADPQMLTNQAGCRVNPNTGFGVPDAGRAVRLARTWPARPPVTEIRLTNVLAQQIPDEGLRVETFGSSIPLQLASITVSPGMGLHPGDLTPFYPLVDVGQALGPLTNDLTGSVAFIHRGGNTFREKLDHAAQAGAALAIIANDPGDTTRVIMNAVERTRIPAVFMAGPDGAALRNYAATNGQTLVRAILFPATITNHVGTPLLLEHVGLRVRTDHTYRGNLRITVTSPAGTRSVLQQINDDYTAGPADWTYWSTHHFHESSQGVWTIQVSDEHPGGFGNWLHSELILRGVPITDADRDGLDDDWERTHFGSLAPKPHEDADDDGESNLAEYLQGTDPLSAPAPLLVSAGSWSTNYVRLGWPGMPHRNYQVLGSTNVFGPWSPLTNLPGAFDTGEWFVPGTNQFRQFFQIRSVRP